MTETNKLHQFIEGFQRFQSKYFVGEEALYHRLKLGQDPSTLLIGCCDSRVDPALLLDCDPGDIFVVRNVANLVPPCSDSEHVHGVSAAIQFAVESLQVQRIIVMGHEKCGGIRALMQPAQPDQADQTSRPLDFIGRWMRMVEPVKQQVLQRLAHCSQEEQHRACEMGAVIMSLNHLRSFPWVAEREAAGSIVLHGWYFDMSEGALLAYSERSDSFLPMVCPLGVAQHSRRSAFV
ncbi:MULTISPECIES: carbonic anhydrase [unclassified Undibacterium]|uniref:carbonic anhydrase n=1 Tax=unclassified Undibacterium TaxID=2630295 RepID=UPI002AC92C88|nr:MULTISPECIES: carbonic anhydrase [unclassified Undibacterium]MEB0138088.1 carbonic anhydrase [Undibacterium sp. CCC2.1]MEB0171174.1 carbonic anhydrase [Undibacterium sp. CCC1.1]MEB0175219.1 carbonic anhydrase [Undibacterium sp. CCC3.4]MEB0214627.1 carbonic anhydrase [Undibacterium sp. 5I2]WPX42395.1 carbonic anhydrase [Undibacterium sp. CCC3.4]